MSGRSLNWQVTRITRKCNFGNLSFVLCMLVLAATACAQPNASQNQANPEKPSVEKKSYAVTLDGLLAHSVPEMDVSQAAGLNHAILLDARENDEFAVSRIDGAQWVGYDDFSLDRVAGLDKNDEIIVYCSVGYRSEKVAEQLMAAGFTRVHNLYGGIFEWVNRGQGVVDADGLATEKVHAYSRSWGVFLREGKKVYGKPE